MLVNRRLDESPISSATPDDREGIRLAVQHLVELGHKRIAHLAGPLDYSTGRDRHDGFLAEMRAAGLEPDPELILVRDGLHRGRGRAPVRGAARRAAGSLTAIAAANDLLALGCYDVFAERGVAARATSRWSASTTCRSPPASTRR